MATNESQKWIITLLSETDDKSLVCLWDSDRRYHCGYCYQTEVSFVTIVCWEDNKVVRIETPGSVVVMNFPDNQTKKDVGAKFKKKHFTCPIQEDEAMDLVGNAMWDNRKIISQGMLQSRTFICYLTAEGYFKFGFGYRNGSNVRLKCLIYVEDEGEEVPTVQSTTTHRGAFVLAFPDCMADYGRSKAFEKPENFVETDFYFQNKWFDENRRKQAKEELRKVDEGTDELVSLFIQLDIGKREEFMNVLKTDVENLEKIKKEDGKTTQMKREN